MVDNTDDTTPGFSQEAISLPIPNDDLEYIWSEAYRLFPNLYDVVLDSSQFNHILNAADSSTNETFSEAPIEPIPSTSVVTIPENSLVSSVACGPSSLPASSNWEGPYKFGVSFAPQEKNTKGVTWTYSALRDKLYVRKDVPCQIIFSANIAPPDVSIRVTALYASPMHGSEIVQRCLNHSLEELNRKVFEAEHLVRCASDKASYHIDEITKRHSVVVPFEVPRNMEYFVPKSKAVGQHYSAHLYRFACFGSCAGGPNRRPIVLIFTLEKDGQVVGRRRLDVKICACPGRDRKAEEQQLSPSLGNDMPKKRKESDLVNLADILQFTKDINVPSSKKTKWNGKLGRGIIKADDEEQYEFLQEMKRFFIICRSMKSMSPDLLKALSAYHERFQHDGDSSSS